MPLLVFEFLGTTELLVIALVALIIFGPRKLPEIGRTIGRSMAEFKRASEDFRRTWEFEVEVERRQTDPPAEPGSPAPSGELTADGAEAGDPPLEDWAIIAEPDAEPAAAAEAPAPEEQTIARAPSSDVAEPQPVPARPDATAPEREKV